MFGVNRIQTGESGEQFPSVQLCVVSEVMNIKCDQQQLFRWARIQLWSGGIGASFMLIEDLHTWKINSHGVWPNLDMNNLHKIYCHSCYKAASSRREKRTGNPLCQRKRFFPSVKYWLKLLTQNWYVLKEPCTSNKENNKENSKDAFSRLFSERSIVKENLTGEMHLIIW